MTISLQAIVTAISCLCASNNNHNVFLVNSNDSMQQYNEPQATQKHHHSGSNTANNYQRQRPPQRHGNQHNPYEYQAQSAASELDAHLYARADFGGQEEPHHHYEEDSASGFEREQEKFRYDDELKKLNDTITNLEYKLMRVKQLMEDNFFILRFGIQGLIQAATPMGVKDADKQKQKYTENEPQWWKD